MITKNLPTLKINKLTKTQYERELAAGRIDENALYLVPDGDEGIEYATVEQLKAKATVHYGITEPDDSIGVDGDIYIMYEE